MEEPQSHRTPWIIIAVCAVIMLAVLLRPRSDPDAELARAAREAVALAREAQSNNWSADVWAGRYRLLAVAVGGSVPLVVVYLIWRCSATGELDPVELIDVLGRYALLELAPPADDCLPSMPNAAPALPDHDDAKG